MAAQVVLRAVTGCAAFCSKKGYGEGTVRRSYTRGGLSIPTVRVGLLALPLAGLLTLWATVAGAAFFDYPETQVDPREVAQAYDSTSYFLSQFVGYVVGFTLLAFGIFALTVYLSDIRGERWALGAMVLGILGIGLLLSRYGLRTYAVPALGGAYLNGDQGAVEMVNVIFGDPTRSVFYAAFLLYSVGFILFGFAVWGSETLPRWAGVLLALHAPLLSAPLPEPFSVLGSLLLLAGGSWIAFTVLRRPPARVRAQVGAEEESQARSSRRIRRSGAA